MAVVHVIGAGSDAGSLWLQVPLALTMSLALTLPGYRLLGGRSARGAPSRGRAPALPADAATSGYRPLWARNTSPPAG